MANHGTASQLHVDGAYVEFQQAVLRALPRDIDPDVAERWRNNGQGLAKALREALLPQDKPAVAPAPAQSPLIPVGTTAITATTELFVARESFVVNIKRNAPVKVSHLGDNFKEWFLPRSEAPFEGSTLKYGKLSRNSLDGPIIAELGGEEKAETSLTEIFALMKAQKNGEEGPLLNNGYANIFYVRDVNNVLRAVGVRWHVDGWDVRADSVSDPCEWDDGDQVFSRNS